MKVFIKSKTDVVQLPTLHGGRDHYQRVKTFSGCTFTAELERIGRFSQGAGYDLEPGTYFCARMGAGSVGKTTRQPLIKFFKYKLDRDAAVINAVKAFKKREGIL